MSWRAPALISVQAALGGSLKRRVLHHDAGLEIWCACFRAIGADSILLGPVRAANPLPAPRLDRLDEVRMNLLEQPVPLQKKREQRSRWQKIWMSKRSKRSSWNRTSWRRITTIPTARKSRHNAVEPTRLQIPLLQGRRSARQGKQMEQIFLRCAR